MRYYDMEDQSVEEQLALTIIFQPTNIQNHFSQCITITVSIYADTNTTSSILSLAWNFNILTFPPWFQPLEMVTWKKESDLVLRGDITCICAYIFTWWQNVWSETGNKMKEVVYSQTRNWLMVAEKNILRNKKYVLWNVYLPNAVKSYTSFPKYLTCNFSDLELGRFKVIQGQKSWCQSTAHWWFPLWPLLGPTSYLAPYSRYVMPKLCELDLGRFNVIQGHRSWCQSIAYGRFPFRLPLTRRRICHRFRDIWN